MELLIIIIICAFVFGGSDKSSSTRMFGRKDRSNTVRPADHTPKRHNWLETDYHGRSKRR